MNGNFRIRKTAELIEYRPSEVHLSKDGISNALLDAWLTDPKADAQKRIIDAINNFHDKKQTKNEQATVTEN